MPDPTLPEADQLDAAIQSSLRAFGLAEVDRKSFSAEFVALRTAEELEEALLGEAVRVGKDGYLLCLIATPVSGEGIAYSAVVAKRAEEAKP